MTRDQLIASLTAAPSPTGWYAADGRYADWSARTDDGGYLLEVGDGTTAGQAELTRSELEALHAAITRTLLADAD